MNHRLSLSLLFFLPGDCVLVESSCKLTNFELEIVLYFSIDINLSL
jgi:hypothetical protein